MTRESIIYQHSETGEVFEIPLNEADAETLKILEEHGKLTELHAVLREDERGMPFLHVDLGTVLDELPHDARREFMRHLKPVR